MGSRGVSILYIYIGTVRACAPPLYVYTPFTDLTFSFLPLSPFIFLFSFEVKSPALARALYIGTYTRIRGEYIPIYTYVYVTTTTTLLHRRTTSYSTQTLKREREKKEGEWEREKYTTQARWRFKKTVLSCFGGYIERKKKKNENRGKIIRCKKYKVGRAS